MVQFTGFASYTYVFSARWPKGPGFPIRKSRVTNACLSARPSLSQTTTSFIASNCLGIHHIRLFAWPYNLNDLHNGVLFRKLNVSHLLWSRDCSKLLAYHRIIRLKYTNSRPLYGLKPKSLAVIVILNLKNKWRSVPLSIKTVRVWINTADIKNIS